MNHFGPIWRGDSEFALRLITINRQLSGALSSAVGGACESRENASSDGGSKSVGNSRIPCYPVVLS